MEGGHRRFAAVEAEDELVDIVWQVFGADAVMGAFEPGFEVGEGAVDVGQVPGGVGGLADGHGLVVVSVAERRVALPGIGQEDTAGRDGAGHEGAQRRAGEIVDDGKPDATCVLAANLDGPPSIELATIDLLLSR